MKITLLGAPRVGKTSIIKRYVEGTFDPDMAPSRGALEYTRQVPASDPTQCIQLKIWDTAGEEVYHCITPMYFRDADAVLLVFSVADQNSLDSLDFWAQEVKDKGRENCLIAIVANQIDREDKQVSLANASDYAHARGYSFWPTSALTGNGIPDMFYKLAETKFPNAFAPFPSLENSEAPAKAEKPNAVAEVRKSFRVSRESLVKRPPNKCKC